MFQNNIYYLKRLYTNNLKRQDILKYSIGDFLSPTTLRNNSIETQIQQRNDAVGTKKKPYETALHD